MKKFLAVLMIITFTATSAYARPNHHYSNNRRPSYSHNIRHEPVRRVVKVKHSNAVPYLIAGVIGGVLINSMANPQPQVVYNTVPLAVPTPIQSNNVSCTTTVSYDGRTTTETCTTVRY